MSFFKNFFFKGFLNKNNKEFSLFLKNLLGFSPKSIDVYHLALRHKSVIKNSEKYLESNERLEFLGDAVLNTVVSEYLYQKYPKDFEGGLSKMRSKLVNRPFLNKMGLKLRLDEVLKTEINPFEKPRSIYGDALEALIGAVYIDKGYAKAKNFVLIKILQSDTIIDDLLQQELDYKSKLIEWAQKNKVSASFEVQEVTKDQRSYHAKLIVDGQEVSFGSGLTKKEAEQNAAKSFFSKKTAK